MEQDKSNQGSQSVPDNNQNSNKVNISGRNSKNKKKKRKKIIILAIVLIVIALLVVKFFNNKNNVANTANNAAYTTQTVSRGDIKVELTGSGTLEPANSYTVIALISGEILSADFEEGDTVDVDTVLYQVDSSDAKTSLDRAELNYSQMQKSYDRLVESLDDLNVKADKGGTVVDINVDEGDDVQAGQILAHIRNSDTMTITLPFDSADTNNFYIGQKAQLSLEGTYETIEGTISKIKNVEEVLDGYRLVKKVTMEVTNPGGITAADKATALINGMACAESANFEYRSEYDVKALLSGNIQSIKVNEGDFVSEKQLLIMMDSTDLRDNIDKSENSLKDAKLSLENQYEKLDEYTLTSPIYGTIIEKDYKTGDKMESGKVLCKIFDLSYLSMTLNVDELDISQLSVGQTVNITADAVENKQFEGVVTKISINGTTTNGVTVYPVTIRIDKTDGLLPGMNVDASIEVVNKTNVLSIPVSAVSRGNKVLVKTQGQTSAADNAGNKENTENTDNKQNVNNENNQQNNKGNNKNMNSSPLEGYEYVVVELGVSNDDYIEVLSGLNEGDEIAYIKQVSTGMGMDMFMGPGVEVQAGPGPQDRPQGGPNENEGGRQ